MGEYWETTLVDLMSDILLVYILCTVISCDEYYLNVEKIVPKVSNQTHLVSFSDSVVLLRSGKISIMESRIVTIKLRGDSSGRRT
jgi:hypothetical protein